MFAKNLNTKPYILTFGSTGWDRVFYKNDDGSEELIYEEEGRKNSHQALAALRASGGKYDSILVSFVGDDEIGKKCLESLKTCGIDTRFVKTVPGETTEINHQYIDKVTRDYTLKRFPAILSQNYDEGMVSEYADLIRGAKFVILVSKQPKGFLTKIIDFCYQNGVPTVLTVSHKKFDVTDSQDLETLRKCTFIAGNYEEGKDLTLLSNEEDIIRFLPNFIMTKGADGVYFFDRNRVIHEEAVKSGEVVETNGAGDTFIGNFIVFYLEGGGTITDYVRKSMCASTLEIQKMGALNAIPKREQTEKLFKEYYSKIYSDPEQYK